MNDEEVGIKINARMLPFPQSISPEAQAVLRRLVNEDGVPLNSLHTMPAIDDHDGWLAVKEATGRYYTALAEQLAPTLRSSVETVKTGNAIIHIATPAEHFNTEFAGIELHGGAFVFGGGEACRVGAQMQADQLGIRCFSIDYRMPPEHCHPAALDDCLAAYRYVLDRHEPGNIIIGGRSAGGNLAVAMLLRARDEGLPFPAALILLSPEVDLTESGDSFQVNTMIDAMLPISLMQPNLLYAGGADLTDPYVSPLFGDFDGFPPTFLQTGTRDLFLSNAVRMHRSLRRAGVSAELHVFEAMPHGGFTGVTPEDAELLAEIGNFVKRHLNITNL